MPESLRICMVTTFYPPYHFGGDAVYIHRLANGLAARGHRVTVVHCLDSFRALGGTRARGSFENHPNVDVRAISSAVGALSPVMTQQTGSPAFKARALRAILEDRELDLIHYHNVSLIGGPKVLEYGRALKFYTPHEYWLVCPTHVLFKMNREACTAPTCLTCTAAYGRPPQLWRYTGLLERSIRHIDAFLAPSRFVATMHADRGLTLPVEHLPLFVPDPGRHSPVHELVQERPFFLYVGRLEKLKGVQDLIGAFREFSGADLVVVGTGNYEQELRSLADGLSHVRFLGRLGLEECRALMSDCLAVVVPSLCYETFGTVVVEAFSVGTPVIARDIGALRELVEDRGVGVLFRDREELVAALEALVADEPLRSAMGARARTAYEENWTEGAHIDRYLSLVERVTAEKQAGAAASRSPSVRL